MTTMQVLNNITPGDVGLFICNDLTDQIRMSQAINSLKIYVCAVMPDRYIMVRRKQVVN